MGESQLDLGRIRKRDRQTERGLEICKATHHSPPSLLPIAVHAQNQREAEQKPLSHAETLAINAAAESLGSWRLDSSGEVSLYVTLEPCLMCYGAAALARIGRIVYGARSDKGGAIVGVG